MGNQHTLFLKGLASTLTPGETTFTNDDFTPEYVDALSKVVNHYYGPEDNELKRKHADKLENGTVDYAMLNDYFKLDTVFEDYDINTIGDEIKTTLGQFSVQRDGDSFKIRDVYDFSNVGGLSDIPGKIANAESSKQAVYDVARTVGGVLLPENTDGSSNDSAPKIELAVPAFSPAAPQFNVDNPQPMARPDMPQTTLVGRETPEVQPEPVELQDRPQPIEQANPVARPGAVETQALGQLPQEEPEPIEQANPVARPGEVETRELADLPPEELERANPVAPRAGVEVNELADLPPEEKQQAPAPQRREPVRKAPVIQVTRPEPKPANTFVAAATEIMDPNLAAGLASSFVPEPDVEVAPGDLGEVFGRGVAAGLSGVDSDLEYFAALANTIMGDEEAAQSNVRNARLSETLAADALSGLQSFEEFIDEPTVGGFIDQAVVSVGQITPAAVGTIAAALGTGGVAALGTLAANKSTQGVTKKLVKELVEKKVRGEALDETEEAVLQASYNVVRNFKRGAVGGAFAAEYPQMGGAIGAEFDEAGRDIDAQAALTGLLGGVPLAAVGVAGEKFVVEGLAKLALNKASKTNDSLLRQYAKDITKGVALGGATEAATEVVQEGALIGLRTAIDDDYTAQEAQLRLGQAAFAGFFGGGGLAGAGATAASTFRTARAMVDRVSEARASAAVDAETTGFTGSGPTVESQADIDAQVAAAFDTNSSKPAAWIPESSGSPQIDIPNDNETTTVDGPDGQYFAARIPGQGVIISPTKAVVDEVVAGQANDSVLAAALGYSAARPDDADRVVRVTDSNGNVISEEATNAEGEASAVTAAQAIATEGQTVDTVDVKTALEQRRQRFEAENTDARDIFVDDVEFSEQETPEEETLGEFAPTDPSRRDADFDERFQAMLDSVPVERQEELNQFRDIMSDSLLRRLTEGVQGDPDNSYFVEQENGRLVLKRVPTGRGLEGGQAVSFIQNLLRRVRRLPLDARRNTNFGIVSPDGKILPVTLDVLISEGIKLNVRTNEALQGEGLTPAQSAKQGLIRAVSELLQRGYRVQIGGRDMQLSRADLRFDNGEPVYRGLTLTDILTASDPRPAVTSSEQRQDARTRKAGERAVQRFDRQRERRRQELQDDGLTTERIEDLLDQEFSEQRRQQVGRDAARDEELGFDQDRIIPTTDAPEGDQDARAQAEAQRLGVFRDEVADNEQQRQREVAAGIEPEEVNQPYTWSRILAEDVPAPGRGEANPANRRGPKVRVDRPAKGRKRVNVRINGTLGPLTSRVLGRATKLFNFSRPIDVFTLSELKSNFDKHTGEGGLFSNAADALQDTINRMEGEDSGVLGRVISSPNRAVIIIRDDVEGGTVDDATMAAVIAHEVGHLVFDEEFNNISNGSPVGRQLWEAYKQHVADMDQIPSQYDMTKQGFEEWYADQVAAYVYDRSKQATNGAQSYFKSIARKLTEFFNEVNKVLGGRLTQNEVFARYMDGVAAAHSNNLRNNVEQSQGRMMGVAEKLVIREFIDDVRNAIPPEIPRKLQQGIERIMRTGTYQWFSKYLVATDNMFRGMGPAGVQIARFFYGKSQSKEDIGFHKAKNFAYNRYLNQLADILGLDIKSDEVDWESPEIVEIMSQVEDDSIPTDELTGKAKQVRQFFEKVFDEYITNKETGRPWFAIGRRRNYAPRLLDLTVIEENPQGAEAFFQNYMSEEEAKLLVEKLLQEGHNENENIPQDDEDLEANSPQARLSPGMDSALTRTLGSIPTKDLRRAGLLQPPGLAAVRYLHHVTRKVEFERRGGFKRLDTLLQALPEERRGDAETAILGNLGKRGANMSPWARQLNSIAAVHTALTTLLFATLSSLPDLAAVVMRSKEFGSLSDAYKQMKSTLTEEENMELARTVGTVTTEALDNMFIATGELDFANKWARNTMNVFFKYTGLQWYTRYTRAFATGMGREFLLNTAKSPQFDTRKARYLEELGLTREEVLAWDESGRRFDTPEGEKVRDAIAQFSDEAIIRPNAAERPSWASNPYLTMVWSLKSYFYAYGKTVVGGMGREFSNRYREDGNFEGAGQLALLAAGTIIPLTALGLEMREYTKWLLQAIVPGVEASGRVFRSDYMDAGEYTVEMIDRSGILGPWTMALSAYESVQRGDNILIGQIPFVDAFDDTLIDGDWNRPIPVLNNIQ